jgi:hypothetical protein
MARPRPQRHRIPFGRHSTHFAGIQNSLALVLYEIRAIPALSRTILWVSCRLNRSGTIDSPVFVGWVEDTQAIRIRVQKGYLFAPIDIRFGDTHPSKLYRDCLNAAPGQLVPRKWTSKPESPGSQEIGKNFYDETHRRSVPIKIKGCSVGTLNAAFQGNPAAEDMKIEKILFHWAQKKSGLVDYIEQNLDYSPKR